MKVVIDTNVFVSSFLNISGPPRTIVDLWKQGKITLCLCAEILAEYIEVLERLHIPPADLKTLLQLFQSRQHLEFVVISGDLSVVTADPADDKFIECSLISGAAVLISGDKHLLRLGRFESLRILKPSAFLVFLKE